jgi:hypothetical protein
MRRSVLCAHVLLIVWVRGDELAAQSTSEPGQVFAGVEARILSFGRSQTVRRMRQLAVPLGLIVPLRRLRVDVGTAFVSTELRRADSSHHQVSHLTDTQVRGSYVVGADALVATLALNLPTGPSRASPRDYAVLGAVSPSFLGFPVAAYSSGFSATGGVAAAIPLRSTWSIGIAGSLRVSSRFTPYADANGPITYKPGFEGRVRGGADGLIGSSRLSAGFTYSTFGDDQFGLGGTGRAEYRPGPRWLAEAALTAPIGSASLNLSLWNFRRAAGDTTGASARNRENLFSADCSVAIPLGRALLFAPGLSGRVSKPQSGRARMLGAGAGFRVRLSERFSLLPTARYDSGWVEDAAHVRTTVRGWYVSTLLRAGL